MKFIIMSGANNYTRRVILAGCLALAMTAAAQHYPSKTITIIAPSSPGGPVDFTARFIAPPLSKIRGQQIVVENRPGAFQKIGTQAYVTAAGVPPYVVEKLQNALLAALRSHEARNAFAAVGFQVVGSSPQEFAAAVRAELERNRKLIDSGAIKVD
jgi:tripartite-type tricarboxylate transporter receptor subunit TctC